jgi:thioredoxin-related protein
MKKFILLLAACLTVSVNAAPAKWLSNFEAAKAQAKNEKKMLLMNFTGSDWCIWCKKLQSEVFTKPEFIDYANKNLVLLEVDFPNGKPQTDAQKKANEALSEKFGVEGFPTLIVLNSDGKPIGKLGYEEGGAKPFVARVEKLKK